MLRSQKCHHMAPIIELQKQASSFKNRASILHPIIKGPDHLQKNLFSKNHKSYVMPKIISKTSFGRILLRLKILQVPSKMS